MSDGGIGEGIKGIVGGTVTTVKNELKEAGKIAVQQTVKPLPSNASPQSGQTPNTSYKISDEQKIAQIKSKLHNEMISFRPQTNDSQKPTGPIAEQSFRSSQPQTSQMQTLETSHPKRRNIAVDNAVNPGEQGRSKKG